MNIAQAKKNIRDSVRLYLKKDADGNYLMPVVRQRPIFLKGAPGIGKTAIMEQVAQELGIALVSYSMTHHTRQSALGLPFIEKKNYGGEECAVSEYTMSEMHFLRKHLTLSAIWKKFLLCQKLNQNISGKK